MSRNAFLAIAIVMILGGAYIYGIRIVSVSEWPSSKRPWSLMLTAEAGS